MHGHRGDAARAAREPASSTRPGEHLGQRRPRALLGLLAVLSVVFGLGGVVGSPPTGSRPESTQLTSSTTPGWYDAAWPYRRAVQVGYPGSGSTTVSNYQVQIRLDSSFDFSHMLANGNDLRVTAEDGTTAIPFWIEAWDPAGASASIWVKVPTIPVGGTTVYLYYGNPAPSAPAPSPVASPPIGPFTKAANNPQVVANTPCGGATPQLLPENMVASGGKYYVVVADRCNTNAIGLLVANSPSGPWSYDRQILTPGDLQSQGDPRTQLDSPDLVQVGSDWYVFYSHYDGTWNDTTDPALIGLAESTTGIDGTYTEINPSVLATDPTGTWDDARVAEPYVLQEANGDWVMVYMGDADPAGGFTEQVGIATSTQGITGPYTKSPENPVLAFGPPGSLDAGTIADPWVVDFQGTYYVGYTASPTKAGWNTTYATTTDWQTFTKSNTVILPQGGSYDSVSAFRGAVSLVGDTYYFPYTSQDSSGFHFSMATQPLMATPPNIVNSPSAVFDFYDGFSGSTLDGSKWTVSTRETAGGSATVSGGLLALTAPVNGPLDVEELTSTASFGPGDVLFEASVRHDTASGDSNTAGEVGFGTATFDPSLRIVDYSDPAHFQMNVSNAGQGGNTFPALATPLDRTEFHLHRIGWAQPGVVSFALDDAVPASVGTNIPTQPLPVWLAAVSVGEPAAITVDWVRVRNWVGADAPATVGAEEAYLVGTGTAVTSTANPSTYGDPVSFTATVSTASGSAVPTGTVQFSVDGTDVGSPVELDSQGKAALAVATPLGSGAHAVAARYLGTSGFGPSSGSLTQTVDPAPLTITASSPTGVVYGDPVPTIAPQYTGWVSGEGAGVLGTAPTCSTNYTQGSPVGRYATSCSGAVAANYTISYVPGSFDVGQARQHITVGIHAPESAVFGSTFTVAANADSGLAVEYGASGPCTNDGATFTMTGGTGTCTVTYRQPGDENFSSAAPATESVAATKAPLTVTAKDASVQYSDPLPALSARSDGFVLGQGPGALAGTLSCAALGITHGQVLADVGTYPITCSGLSSDDYAISYLPGTLQVTAEDTLTRLSSANPLDVSATRRGRDVVVPDLTFSARITEVADGSYGDITKAFTPTAPVLTLQGVGSGASTAVACRQVLVHPAMASSPGWLLVSCSVAGSRLRPDVYRVSLGVGGAYYTGSDTGVLVVSRPSPRGAHGAGTVALPGGATGSFGFVAELGDGRTPAQGAVLYIVKDAGGTVTHVLAADTVPKLTLDRASRTAVLSGPATLDGTGGFDFALTAVDGRPDRFGIRVGDAAGNPAPGLSTSGLLPVAGSGSIAVGDPPGPGGPPRVDALPWFGGRMHLAAELRSWFDGIR